MLIRYEYNIAKGHILRSDRCVNMNTVRKTPLEKLRDVVSETVSHIQDFTKSPTDFIRNRKLNAQTTLELILNMQGNSLNAELLNAFPDVDERMTASAFEQAKGKLKPSVFRYMFDQFNKAIPNTNLLDGKYRVYAIDGTDFTTPYDKKSNRIMPTSSEEKPVCMTHANILYDIENKTYQDIVIQERLQANERVAAIEMIERLDTTTPSIVIMDRGYDGFNMIEHCNRKENCFYIIRGKATKKNSTMKELEALPESECDVDIEADITTSGTFYRQYKNTNPRLHFIDRPTKRHKETYSENTRIRMWDFENKCTVKFRVVKFRISEDGKDAWEILITNLNRFEFPIERMKEMYHKRWDIETSFRSLKYALGGINFHSKKDEFIDMEIYAHLIMFNVVSACVNQVEVVHKNDYALDFKMACHLVRHYFHRKNNKPYGCIFDELLRYINPIRLGRQDKRKMKPKSAVWFVYRVA